jgi:hypothetical protein
VSGASNVALSLDDPTFYMKNGAGSYGEFPSSGTIDFAFECDPTVLPNTTHTYTLNTVSKPSVAMTLTVTVPTNP